MKTTSSAVSGEPSANLASGRRRKMTGAVGGDLGRCGNQAVDGVGLVERPRHQGVEEIARAPGRHRPSGCSR